MPESKRIEYIDYIKAIAIILVVIDHSLVLLYGSKDNMSPIIHNIYSLIEAIHVPSFFMISGYLTTRRPVLKFYRSKIQRVFIPFLFFTTLKLLYSSFISPEFKHATDTFNRLFDAYVLGRLYWFLFTIFIMYLLAPLFWGKYGTKLALITVSVLLGINTICTATNTVLFPLTITVKNIYIENPFFQIDILIKFLPFFLFGMIARQNTASISEFVRKNQRALLIGSVLILLTQSYSPFYTTFPLSMSLFFILWSLCKKIPKNIRILNKISGYTLQILLFDSFFKIILFSIASKLLTPNLPIMLILAFCDIFLSIISSEIIRRIPYVRILFGLTSPSTCTSSSSGCK